MEKLKRILGLINIGSSADEARITPFKSAENGQNYEVWRVTAGSREYVLKKAKNHELQIYSELLSHDVVGAPLFLGSARVDGIDYFLMEYVHGDDLRRCDRAALTKALDALIWLQNKYWEATDKADVGLSFDKSLIKRHERSSYLGNEELECEYAKFLSVYEMLPRTLCHDDFLPFNVLISDSGATIIDWEIAGILPYPTSLARLLAHCEESDDAFFYMKDEDKLFAIDYYYDKLLKDKGIDYAHYRRDLDLFIFYEYCEWIMLGNKYADADMERYQKYLSKAKEHIKNAV